MEFILDSLKSFSDSLSWPLIAFVLALVYRKPITDIFEILKERMKTAAKISIGGDNGLNIEQMIAKAQQETVAMIAQGVGKATSLADTKADLTDTYQDDPLKAAWSGTQEDKGKRISATVEEIPGSGLYRLKIFVRSIYQQEPLQGKVQFYLHPSFSHPNPVVQAQNGEAYLQLISYGSFTLGAKTEDGASLKLDLATDVPGVTETFKNS